MGLVAPRHVGSSQTRDGICVPCIGREFLITGDPVKSWLLLQCHIWNICNTWVLTSLVKAQRRSPPPAPKAEVEPHHKRRAANLDWEKVYPETDKLHPGAGWLFLNTISWSSHTHCCLKDMISRSLVAQRLKCLPPMQETRVQSLGQEDPLEKEMATHSSILAWRIPRTEELGRLQSMGSQRVGHDWVTSLSLSLPDPWSTKHTSVYSSETSLHQPKETWEVWKRQGTSVQEQGKILLLIKYVTAITRKIWVSVDEMYQYFSDFEDVL